MIEKTIKVIDLHSEQVSDVEHWKSRPVEERLNALEFLRRQMYDPDTERLQRVLTVIKRK